MGSLPIDFNFEYEKPEASRRGEMRTPVTVYIPAKQKTGGILFIAQKWLDHNAINGSEIALQVKGENDTFIVFNPPKQAPRFMMRKTSPKKGTISYSCTESVRKMIDIFNPNKTHVELWLEKVGTFKDSIVCRLRNIQPEDSLYKF